MASVADSSSTARVGTVEELAPTTRRYSSRRAAARWTRMQWRAGSNEISHHTALPLAVRRVPHSRLIAESRWRPLPHSASQLPEFRVGTVWLLS